jgi:hypothetical protein
VLQEQPQLQGGLEHEIPAGAAAGIKIEGDLIGVFDPSTVVAAEGWTSTTSISTRPRRSFKAVRHIRTLSPPAASGGPAPQTSG